MILMGHSATVAMEVGGVVAVLGILAVALLRRGKSDPVEEDGATKKIQERLASGDFARREPRGTVKRISSIRKRVAAEKPDDGQDSRTAS